MRGFGFFWFRVSGGGGTVGVGGGLFGAEGPCIHQYPSFFFLV